MNRAMMDRQEWLQLRRTGVGGSDVAAILGLSPYATPLAVYLDKRGEGTEQADNAAMRWGRLLEPVVRQAYSDATGRPVRVPDGVIRSQSHDHMVATLDGIAGDGSEPFRVFEAKTARTAEGWGEPGSDDIPHAYGLQVHHYMAVTGLLVADVAVLIGGSDFRIYTVEADTELQELIIEAEAEFWQRVQRGEPPAPVTVADAVARWGRASKAEVVMADADAMAAIETLRKVRSLREHVESEEMSAKAVVMRTLGDADTLVGPDGRPLATWKAAKPAERIDTTALRKEYPELAERFTRIGEPSRRFLLKN